MSSSITPQSLTPSKTNHFPTFLRKKPLISSFNNLTFPHSSLKVSHSRLVSYSVTTSYDATVVDEEMDQIRRLQNGSDVRGVALEGEKGRQVNLTPPAVEAIAESFGEWVSKGLEKEIGDVAVKVSVGRDPRISGAKLATALFTGLGRAGCEVFDMGLATTPACFMSTMLPNFMYDASIMVVW